MHLYGIDECEWAVIKTDNYKKKKMDSRMLADELNTTIQVINNRTTTLSKLGIIKRNSEDAPTGGKQYIYESII